MAEDIVLLYPVVWHLVTDTFSSFQTTTNQLMMVPRVLRRSGGEQFYRERVEVQALEETTNKIRAFAVVINAVEDIACGLPRQLGDHQALAMLGDGRGTRNDKEAYRFQLAQFIHHSIDVLDIRSLGVKNGLDIVEDYDHFLGGKEGA